MHPIGGAAVALARTGRTIFVGRGAHFYLQRERIRAVRFVYSMSTAATGFLQDVKKLDTQGIRRPAGFIFQFNISIVFNELFDPLPQLWRGTPFAQA